MPHKIDELTTSIEIAIDNMEDERDKGFFDFVLRLYQRQRKSINYFQMLYEHMLLREKFMKQANENS